MLMNTYNISFTDKDAVLALAKSLKVDGIVCFTSDAAAYNCIICCRKVRFSNQSI